VPNWIFALPCCRWYTQDGTCQAILTGFPQHPHRVAVRCKNVEGTPPVCRDVSPSRDDGECRRDTVLVVGDAALPSSLRPFSNSGFLSLVLEVDRETGTVCSVSCRQIPPAAEMLVAELMVGRDLEAAWDECATALRERYYAVTRDALIQALRVAEQQFRQWKRGGPGSARPPSREAPTVLTAPLGYRAAPNSHSQKTTQHGLATQLVTLLAHSRLLDLRERQESDGQPIPMEVRRQAVQLYAVAQQISHRVEAEPGLLQPQIQPIEIPALLRRALNRSAAAGGRVSIEQHLPADLPLARGDPVVLEEALVLLFDEIAAFADSAGTTWELVAEKRRADMLISIQPRPIVGDDGSNRLSKFAAGKEAKPFRELLEGSLATLAARTLVEHQGGRLWIQETFPQEHPSLCLSVCAQNSQEDPDRGLSLGGSAGRPIGDRS